MACEDSWTINLISTPPKCAWTGEKNPLNVLKPSPAARVNFSYFNYSKTNFYSMDNNHSLFFQSIIHVRMCVYTHRKISLTQFQVWPSNLFSNVYRYIQCCWTLLMLARDVHDEGKIYCSYNVKSRLVCWGMEKCLNIQGRLGMMADKHIFIYYYFVVAIPCKIY